MKVFRPGNDIISREPQKSDTVLLLAAGRYLDTSHREIFPLLRFSFIFTGEVIHSKASSVPDDIESVTTIIF